MNFAIISRAAAKNYYYPYQNLLAPPTASRRSGGAVRLRLFTVVSSSCKSDDGDKMDEKADDEQQPKAKDRDAMSHSFGEGYSTRSDEEGFGGIYGGNQAGFFKDENEIHEDHPMYDKSQGSQVKEKEKARNQKAAHS